MKPKISKGDTVEVIAGEHKGYRGEVQTGRIEKEAPIHISNVALIGTDGKPTRAGYEVTAGGDKTRIDRRSNDPLPKPVA